MNWGCSQKENYLSVKISSGNCVIILPFEKKYKVREFKTLIINWRILGATMRRIQHEMLSYGSVFVDKTFNMCLLDLWYL